ncbi:hypothetical protein HMSSN139_46100 [Paenibacillus sp. HMSSN-139]|nr:hypothetical protein HMSSN139_46100 [Paenibacillus sp. HMSSN-139]
MKKSGEMQRSSVFYRHVGQGWSKGLENLLSSLPEIHKVGFKESVQEFRDKTTEYDYIWAEIQN